jgi:hypothetical protein
MRGHLARWPGSPVDGSPVHMMRHKVVLGSSLDLQPTRPRNQVRSVPNPRLGSAMYSDRPRYTDAALLVGGVLCGAGLVGLYDQLTGSTPDGVTVLVSALALLVSAIITTVALQCKDD